MIQVFVFRLVVSLLLILSGFVQAFSAQAQTLPEPTGDRIWLQIEALPDEAGATARAEAWSGTFPDVLGYRLDSGWHGIVLGPYGVAEGAGRLNTLLNEDLIPPDSYIVDGSAFEGQFWPATGTGLPATDLADPDTALAPEPVPEPEPEPEPVIVPDETPQEARASERDLTPEDRIELQTALQWFGHYSAALDGDFGPGTRNSMAEWQVALSLEPTGVLTTKQRAMLMANYRAELAEYGFREVVEAKAGITVTLPMGLVEFDHYEAPFVHYREKNGSGLRVILISQPGDQAAFFGLYDALQTLSVVPTVGERNRGERTFSIKGSSAALESTTFAELKAGLIKGYMVIAKPGQEDRYARVLTAMEQSFAATGDQALDPGLVALDSATQEGLLAGLEVRRPAYSRTGFFIDASGLVLTSAEAVASCGRITLNRSVDATIRLSDEALGIAVLTPAKPVSPRAVAVLQTAPERVGADVLISGYPYESKLTYPVLTSGKLAAVTGLNGEPGLKRLEIAPQAGDIGAPVLDATGAVLGMLLPPPKAGAQTLPETTQFAVASSAIAARLLQEGIVTATPPLEGALAAEILAARARDLTVLVSCWD